jgi:5-formyltetrahydrofolate cyclo-ligase
LSQGLAAISEDKDTIRERIWAGMVKEGAALFPGAHGRIPNFRGAEKAADLLRTSPVWQNAQNIKANPDSPQKHVRLLALHSGKTVYMAVPRLRERKCFIRLDPARIPGRKLAQAATIKGAFQHGIPLHPREVPEIDLIVAGSVAVNRAGSRIGKGGGYSDLEFAVGRAYGFVPEDVPILTTVHSLQVADFGLPETEHDFRIDFIVTPGEIIPTPRRGGRPAGIVREHLTEEKISQIPILKEILQFQKT